VTTWHGDELDLDAYLTRIGFDGERLPTVQTLAALHRAHTTSIPFENLELMLGRPIVLDLDALQNKLIRQNRGGYCYEHVTVFAAALERLGFRFTALAGRVTLGADTKRPRTHALIVVEFDDHRRWLCDVGFGRGPLEPIELIAGNEVDHYVSTSPRSPFTARPFVQRFAADVEHILDGTTWTTTNPDGSCATRHVEIRDVPALLAGTFGTVLSDDDSAALIDWMRSRL
jgi:N-hydroxyarylamine O-acetyltransferase